VEPETMDPEFREISGRPETWPPEMFAADPNKLPPVESQSDDRIAGRPETYSADILNAGHLDAPAPTAGPPYDAIVGRPETWPPGTFEDDPNRPAPVIGTLAPATALTTDPDVSLVVTATAGGPLSPGCVVLFGGTPLVTTFVSATEVDAVIPMAGQSAGAVPVTVRSAAGLTSNALTFTIT